MTMLLYKIQLFSADKNGICFKWGRGKMDPGFFLEDEKITDGLDDFSDNDTHDDD